MPGVSELIFLFQGTLLEFLAFACREFSYPFSLAYNLAIVNLLEQGLLCSYDSQILTFCEHTIVL